MSCGVKGQQFRGGWGYRYLVKVAQWHISGDSYVEMLVFIPASCSD
jgi:hypothetical protein